MGYSCSTAVRYSYGILTLLLLGGLLQVKAYLLLRLLNLGHTNSTHFRKRFK
jgi:hypothetical protein